MKKHTLSVLLLVVLVNFLPAQENTTDHKIDSILQSYFPADGPGCVALVAKDGKTVYHKAFGLANLELQVPMKTGHIFRIGSITKQFTASAILKLEEEGKLSVHDEITNFLPDYPTHGHKITIEHLLTHTSGIRSYTSMSDRWTPAFHKRDLQLDEMLDLFKDEPMDFEPGEKFRYNNSAYFLLGMIIEEVSGKPYALYLAENFFEPLGLKDTQYGGHLPVIENRIPGYIKQGDHYYNAPYLSMSQPYSAGALLSTANDLFTWYDAMEKGKILQKETLERAHSPYVLNSGEKTEYGYGWVIHDIAGSKAIEHGGGINGFLSSSMYFPEERIVVVLLSNCTAHQTAKPAKEVFEVLKQ